jgi:hypothetical protein
MTASVVSAEPSRAAASQPAKAARVKAKSSRSAKPAKPKPVVRAAVSAETDPSEPVVQAEVIKPVPVPTNVLLQQYQRVGRELLLLANERRAQVGVETEDAKLSCADLQATFRSIKIQDAIKTAESRAEAAELLAELHAKVERLRGVALSQECLNNPLAKECT